MKPAIVSRGLVALTIAAASLLMWALPGTAGAAIQLGQLSPKNPPVTCDAGNYIQTAATTVAPYTVPAPGGVITRWSHTGIFVKQPMLPDKTPPAGSGRLQVWDFGFPSTLVGRSAGETFTPGVVTTYLTRIPVSTGDVLGMRAEARTGCRYVGVFQDTIYWESGTSDHAPGETVTPTAFGRGLLLNISAILEPDADADGFGDETQDLCPGQAGPDSGCPPGTAPPPDGGPGDGGPGDGDGSPGDGDGSPGDGPPSNEFSFGKLKKNKRKGTAKLTAELPGPGDLALTETDKVKGTEEQADAAGDEKLAIKPKGKARKKLNKKGKARVEAEVTYTPELGASNTESKKLKLTKR